MERIVAVGMASILWISQVAYSGLPLISNDAFVSVSVGSQDAELPVASPMGTYAGRTSLQVFVASNKPYRVSVAFEGFVNKKGRVIAASDTRLSINNVSVPVGSRRGVPVLVADRTSKKGVALPLHLDFQVFNMQQYPAGAYSGEFAVAVESAR